MIESIYELLPGVAPNLMVRIYILLRQLIFHAKNGPVPFGTQTRTTQILAFLLWATRALHNCGVSSQNFARLFWPVTYRLREGRAAQTRARLDPNHSSLAGSARLEHFCVSSHFAQLGSKQNSALSSARLEPSWTSVVSPWVLWVHECCEFKSAVSSWVLWVHECCEFMSAMNLWELWVWG